MSAIFKKNNIKTVAMLDSGDHGYSKYIKSANNFAITNEVISNLAKQAKIFHQAKTSDMHWENFIPYTSKDKSTVSFIPIDTEVRTMFEEIAPEERFDKQFFKEIKSKYKITTELNDDDLKSSFDREVEKDQQISITNTDQLFNAQSRLVPLNTITLLCMRNLYIKHFLKKDAVDKIIEYTYRNTIDYIGGLLSLEFTSNEEIEIKNLIIHDFNLINSIPAFYFKDNKLLFHSKFFGRKVKDYGNIFTNAILNDILTNYTFEKLLETFTG